jgi:glutathione S-transferase
VNNSTELILYQFAFSHFNEKVRWALDWKGLDADRQSLLPGLHERTLKKLTGSSETPVLVVGGEAIKGSTLILHRLEILKPSPPLFPAETTARAEIDRWIDWLDAEVGPAIRLGLFDEIFKDPRYSAELFSTGYSGLKRLAYTIVLPRMLPVLRSRMAINAATASTANELTTKALDRIVAATKATGFLVGDRFTAADLTAASLLFPLSFPTELPFSLPTRPSTAVSNWTARWRDHPAIAWVEEIFRKHR